MMKPFKINEFLSLKLENNKTFIYVKGRKFKQCKFLLLEIPIKEMKYINEIDSIDEISEDLDGTLENFDNLKLKITPEQEFWGHCSNLQVWFENNYDTNLLHSSLGFPLLKELEIAGDLMAKKVFKEEIAKRLETGYIPVAQFLIVNDYVIFLDQEIFLKIVLEWQDSNYKYSILNQYAELLDRNKFLNIILEGKEATAIQRLEEELNRKFVLFYEINAPKSIYIKGNHVTKLNLSNSNLSSLPKEILYLNHLEYLDLSLNDLTKLPSPLKKLKKLRDVDLTLNKINSKERIDSLRKFPKIHLNFYSKKFDEILKKLQKKSKYFEVIESIEIDLLAKQMETNPFLLEKIILFYSEELEKKGLKLSIKNGILFNENWKDKKKKLKK